MLTENSFTLASCYNTIVVRFSQTRCKKMRKRLEKGTLWHLLKEMPPTLKTQLNKELDELDTVRRNKHKPGDTKVISLAIHLRWIAEHQADLGEMKMSLFPVLSKYLPISQEMVYRNELPTLTDSAYFWGRQIKHAEKGTSRPPVFL